MHFLKNERSKKINRNCQKRKRFFESIYECDSILLKMSLILIEFSISIVWARSLSFELCTIDFVFQKSICPEFLVLCTLFTYTYPCIGFKLVWFILQCVLKPVAKFLNALHKFALIQFWKIHFQTESVFLCFE